MLIVDIVVITDITESERRINPKWSVEHIANTLPFKNKADLELVVNAQRKAGLPD